MTCAPWGLDVDAQADAPALVVLTERLHPGWHVTDGTNELPTFTVNQVHTGVLVPAGTHHLRWRFRPMGLRASAGGSALGLLLSLGALGWLRRQ